jgi:predicted methyltransferase
LADQLIDEVARAVTLAEGRRGVEAVLRALARLEPVSVRALSRAADLPVPIVAAVCGELRRRGVVSEIRPVQFTLEGRRRLAKAGASIATACPTCGGRGVALPPALARLRRGLAAVADSAPSPLVELDQCHCTPKTKVRRLSAMHAAGAIDGRRILILGDDDLMSVALLRFARQFRVPIKELVVLDIDEWLLDFIGVELDGAPFSHLCLRWDAREQLPSSLAGGFDTVVTDPPYTAAGAGLFLTSAVRSLRGEGSDVFLSFGSRRPGVQHQLQRMIVELGLEIRSLTRDFNDYLGAGVLGGTSHLYHLSVAPQASIDETFYTGARRHPRPRP